MRHFTWATPHSSFVIEVASHGAVCPTGALAIGDRPAITICVQHFCPQSYIRAGGWYIVACPRAARPFDAEEQAAEYPPRYYLAMLALADDLQRAASRHRLRGAALPLRIGVHCWPVAGAVVGTMRAFYCL